MKKLLLSLGAIAAVVAPVAAVIACGADIAPVAPAKGSNSEGTQVTAKAENIVAALPTETKLATETELSAETKLATETQEHIADEFQNSMSAEDLKAKALEATLDAKAAEIKAVANQAPKGLQTITVSTTLSRTDLEDKMGTADMPGSLNEAIASLGLTIPASFDRSVLNLPLGHDENEYLELSWDDDKSAMVFTHIKRGDESQNWKVLSSEVVAEIILTTK